MAIPHYKIFTKVASYDKFEALVLSLCVDATCLDKMKRLALDPSFLVVSPRPVSAKSYSNYLRLLPRIF